LRDEKEIENGWQAWNEVNFDKTTETTKQAYRHGRCHMCAKFVSTINLNVNEELLCTECKPTEDEISTKRVLGKNDNDEEEWGRIPIPQSDDSEDDTWFDDESETEEEDESSGLTHYESAKATQEKYTRNKMLNDELAFKLGPRRDGIVRRNDGTLLITDEIIPLIRTLQTLDTDSNPESTLKERELRSSVIT
jgi:hypothetical protein